MNIEKKKIVDLPAVYATAELNLEGRRYLAAASEARGEHAYIIDAQTMEYADLWQGDTGVMNVIQIPGRKQLLAITQFYPIFQSKDAAISLLEPTEKGYMSPWKIIEVMKLPFCHRIGIIQNENGLFVIGCQLCEDKDFQEDWTKPGSIWMAPIPETADGEWKLTKVFAGLTKNHGLFIEDENQVYICSENGVLCFDMAHYKAGERMQPRLITTTPTSDIWTTKVADGKIAGTIEPFHGNTAVIYSLTDETYEKKVSFEIDFGHVCWTGKIFGRNALIIGNRGGEKTLDIIFWETGETFTLDEGVGSTQITVYEDGASVRVLSANHGAGDVSLYILSK